MEICVSRIDGDGLPHELNSGGRVAIVDRQATEHVQRLSVVGLDLKDASVAASRIVQSAGSEVLARLDEQRGRIGVWRTGFEGGYRWSCGALLQQSREEAHGWRSGMGETDCARPSRKDATALKGAAVEGPGGMQPASSAQSLGTSLANRLGRRIMAFAVEDASGCPDEAAFRCVRLRQREGEE